MTRKRKQTLEEFSNNSLLAAHLREETILVHTDSFTGNSCEARIIVTFDLPDGRSMHVNRIIRLKFRELKE